MPGPYKPEDDPELAALESISSGARRSRVSRVGSDAGTGAGTRQTFDPESGMPTSTLTITVDQPRATDKPQQNTPDSRASWPDRNAPEGPEVRQLHEIEPGSDEELEAEAGERDDRGIMRDQRARHEAMRARLRR